MDRALDDVWIDAAAALGIAVERGGDAYVHFDGERLHVADDQHLDADDTVAQLVMHELCHALVQGPRFRHAPDWGLDNTTDRDEALERAAVRLQAHLTGAYGLRARLYPTTPVRAYFEGLPADALGGDDEPARLSRIAALRAAQAPWSGVLTRALGECARRAGVALHKSGHPLAAAGTCGDCTWRTDGGLCRAAIRRVFVRAATPACTRWEGALDCQVCGACCRSAYDSVTVTARDAVVKRHPELIVHHERYLELARAGDRCAALTGPEGGPFACRIYADRPKPCRDLARSGAHCLVARRRVGLSLP